MQQATLAVEDEDEMFEQREFTCPECGSHRFGSSNCNALTIEEMDGHCHGYIFDRPTDGVLEHTTRVKPCSFTWSRKEDDLYFKGTGQFESRYSTGACVS